MDPEIKFDDGDFRLELPMFQGDNFKKNLDIRNKLVNLAENKKCTLSQLALAWLLAQSSNVIPIPGTKHAKNLSSINVKLTSEDLNFIKQIMLIAPVQGTRYPREMFASQNIKSVEI